MHSNRFECDLAKRCGLSSAPQPTLGAYMRLTTDPALRQALHGLYVALFNAKRACPEDFHGGHLTTIQTAIMGIEDYGWRVVGITEEALDLLATVDFNKNKLPRQLCRGHIIDRIETTRLLFEHEAPLGLEEFFKAFLQNDLTKPFPDYIKIDNNHAELFPNGSLMRRKHRKKEREYLRQLHAGLVMRAQE